MRWPDLSQEYYRPNGGDLPAVGSTPTPMTYQRPYTHESDVTVRLRRCREPLPDTRALWLKKARRLRVEPLELEVAQPLPDVCPEHGRPAVARSGHRAVFYDTELHPRFHRQAFEKTLTGFWRLKPAESPPVSTIVVGEWPVCDRCERVSRRYRVLAFALLVSMAIDLIGLVIVSVAEIDALRVPFGLGLIPGSFPIGLVLFVLLLGRSVRKVVFRPIYDERFAFVRAHPEFRAALGQDGG